MLRCLICHRRIAAPLPTGEPVGPTCARQSGLLPPITRRVVKTATGRRAYRFHNQVDWIDALTATP